MSISNPTRISDTLFFSAISIFTAFFVIYVFFRSLLYAQLATIDQSRLFGTLKNSWDLTKGNWWRVFLSFLFTGVLAVVPLILSRFFLLGAISLILMFNHKLSNDFELVMYFVIALSGEIGVVLITTFLLLLINDIRQRKASKDSRTERPVAADNAEITG